MLEQYRVTAFLATTQPERARSFYRDLLGLSLEEESPFALVMKSANAKVRIQKVQKFTPFPFTVLGWEVEDMRSAIKELIGRGVRFERFDGIDQDDFGIWLSPSGVQVCWFKDPDNNLLSLTQFTSSSDARAGS